TSLSLLRPLHDILPGTHVLLQGREYSGCHVMLDGFRVLRGIDDHAAFRLLQCDVQESPSSTSMRRKRFLLEPVHLSLPPAHCRTPETFFRIQVKDERQIGHYPVQRHTFDLCE